VRRPLAWLGAASVLAFVACRQLVGIGDAPPGAGSVDAAVDSEEAAATCGDFAWTAGACDSCMENACCAEATACRGDVTCGLAYGCMAACAGDDDVCRSGCFHGGDGVMAALASCQATACSSDCDLQCGGFFGLLGGWGSQSQPCRSCEQAGSCPFDTECAESVSCVELYFCFDTCSLGDTVCIDNCFYSDPAPLPDAGPGLGFNTQANACASACGSGSSWSCAGHTVWPVATTSPITFQVQVNDSVSIAPIQGVTVRACNGGDGDCQSPLSTATTDGNGLATLTSPLVPFSGYLELTAGGYTTQLQYVYPFLTETTDPGVVVGVALNTTAYIAELGAASGVTLETSLGIIVDFPVDCSDYPGVGVSFSGSGLGGAAQPYYFVSGTPTLQATATSLPTAGGGFLNVAPGLVTFIESANGAPVATVAVQVRANALTHLGNVVPTP